MPSMQTVQPVMNPCFSSSLHSTPGQMTSPATRMFCHLTKEMAFSGMVSPKDIFLVLPLYSAPTLAIFLLSCKQLILMISATSAHLLHPIDRGAVDDNTSMIFICPPASFNGGVPRNWFHHQVVVGKIYRFAYNIPAKDFEDGFSGDGISKENISIFIFGTRGTGVPIQI